MKKISYVLLTLLIIFTMVGCSNNSDTISEKDTSKGSGEVITDLETGEVGNLQNGIRANGKLPNDTDELTDEERKYYKGIVIRAALKLDMNTLKEYLQDNSYELFENIYNNIDYRNMYLKTIGQIIYLEESNAFVTKDVNYVFSKWYTDQWKVNANIPEDVKYLSKEEVNDIYEKYYVTAPFTAGDVGGLYIDIENGKIKYNMNSFLKDIHVYHMTDLDPNSCSEYGGENYACFIFADEGSNLGLGYDNINKDEERKIWKAIYEFDIDSMIKYTEENPKCVETVIYKNCLENYYKNPEKRKIIEEWVAKNCEIYRNLSSVYVYTKGYLDITHPYNTYKIEEKNLIKNLNISQRLQFVKNSEWKIFYDIVEIMKDLNVLE